MVTMVMAVVATGAAEDPRFSTLPGANTPEGQVDPRAVVREDDSRVPIEIAEGPEGCLTPERLAALEGGLQWVIPYSPRPTTKRPAVPGRMMTPVFPKARAYPMQPQVFAEASYRFPKPPDGKGWFLAPTTEWAVRDWKGSLGPFHSGEWVISLSGGGDVTVAKEKERDAFLCQGGSGPMVVVLYCVNDPQLMWVDTTWLVIGDNQ